MCFHSPGRIFVVFPQQINSGQWLALQEAERSVCSLWACWFDGRDDCPTSTVPPELQAFVWNPDGTNIPSYTACTVSKAILLRQPSTCVPI